MSLWNKPITFFICLRNLRLWYGLPTFFDRPRKRETTLLTELNWWNGLSSNIPLSNSSYIRWRELLKPADACKLYNLVSIIRPCSLQHDQACMPLVVYYCMQTCCLCKYMYNRIIVITMITTDKLLTQDIESQLFSKMSLITSSIFFLQEGRSGPGRS